MGNNSKYEDGQKYTVYLEKKVHDKAVKKAGSRSFSALVNSLLIKFIGKGKT